MKRFLWVAILSLIPPFAGCAGQWQYIQNYGFYYVNLAEKDLDWVFLNELWHQEISKEFNLEQKVKIPRIYIINELREDPGDRMIILSECYADHIKIYAKSFMAASHLMNLKTREVYLYNIIAHEFIHYALLYTKDMSKKMRLLKPGETIVLNFEKSQDHCFMLENGYLERILSFIDNHFQDNGKAKKRSLAGLEYQYKKDRCLK